MKFNFQKKSASENLLKKLDLSRLTMHYKLKFKSRGFGFVRTVYVDERSDSVYIPLGSQFQETSDGFSVIFWKSHVVNIRYKKIHSVVDGMNEFDIHIYKEYLEKNGFGSTIPAEEKEFLLEMIKAAIEKSCLFLPERCRSFLVTYI